MEISDLENIKLEEFDGKDEIFKSVRFSKEESELLKYWKYTNKRFGTFIKELIEKDMKEKLNKSNSVNNIDVEKLKQELREELRKELHEEIKQEVLKEVLEQLKNNNKVEEVKVEKKENIKSELMDFMK